MKVAVIGASGYIGSHLVPALVERGHDVVACARHREVLEARGWEGVETRAVDLLDAGSIGPGLQGCQAAYYLVHSMSGGAGFADRDRRAAANFAKAAEDAGLERIIYLGGLQPAHGASEHLRSRGQTGDTLREGQVPVTELRAGIIVGAGSAGFEIIRDLVNHLRIMIVPRWVRSWTAPIALDDIIGYLVGAIETPETAGRTFDVGGPEVLRYEDLLRTYGDVTGRKSWLIHVPVLTPRLSSYWLGLVTSVPAEIARPLVDGLKEDLVPREREITSLIRRSLKTYREAVETALEAERTAPLPARWQEGALRFRGFQQDVSFYSKGEETRTPATAPADALWDAVRRVGGRRGWYWGDWLWSLRGLMDRAVGGPGMRRGRRHPTDIRVGDALDFWRVAAVEPGERLTLVAEMKLPGEAVLEFAVEPRGEGQSTLWTTARFHPRGIPGLLYWYAVTPLHKQVFTRMPKAIVREAERRAKDAKRSGFV